MGPRIESAVQAGSGLLMPIFLSRERSVLGWRSRRRAAQATLCMLLFLAAPIAKSSEIEEPLDIGSRLELFVDNYLIEDMKDTALRLQRPVPAEMAVQIDRPWEGEFNLGEFVVEHNSLSRMYYRGTNPRLDRSYTCYATSEDGISWRKPNLDHFDFQGSKDNNVVVDEKGESIEPHVLLDTRPGVPDEERIKGMAQDERRGPGNMPHAIGYTCADGVRFKSMSPQPQLYCTMRNCFDGDFSAFWSEAEQSYVALPSRFMYQRRVLTDEQLSGMGGEARSSHLLRRLFGDCVHDEPSGDDPIRSHFHGGLRQAWQRSRELGFAR